MLWIVLTEQDASHQIIGCNLAQKDGKHEFWITRPGNKGLKVKESDNKKDVEILKEAVDYAVKNNERTLVI